jgi:hypothetical protein
VAHRVFNGRPECPQEDHVADDVHPTGVHEHGAEQGDGVMAAGDAKGDRGPGAHKTVAAGKFQKKDVNVDQNEECGDSGESARAARCVPQRDQAAHYIPPLPSRMPIP